ncbi:MAG: hypothetical protein U1F52_00565 [Burkholderiales bacterium]
MIPDRYVSVRRLPQGYEFHLAEAATPEIALCGVAVEPTQIPPNFYGIDGAIEGRWCPVCAAATRTGNGR